MSVLSSGSGHQVNQEYEPNGRIKKNSLGDYGYANSYKAYQNTSIQLSAFGKTIYKPENQQSITYNAFKAPVTISQSNEEIRFEYNIFQQRNKAHFETRYPGQPPHNYKTNHYSWDGSMEISIAKEIGSGIVFGTGFTTYIGGDAYSAPLVYKFNGSTGNFLYLHRDYLGSIIAISNQQGTLIEKRHFDAWGKMVSGDIAVLDRGYTGHEHLKNVGLVHMNARLYDADLHRFLAPDNFVQDPFDTQNYNRYGYVLNNPLSYVDPSGEWISLLVGAIFAGVSTLAQGGNLLDIFISGVFGAVTAGFSHGIGDLTNGVGLGLTQASSRILAQTAFNIGAHAVLGGAINAMYGGDFFPGFVSGAFGAAAGGLANKWFAGANGFTSFTGTSVIGGISGAVGSVLSGGNFWDGFRNGLISAGLNHAAHALVQGIHNYFEKKKDAYNYAQEESILLDMGDGYVIEREVSGYALENGDYIVLDPSNNTYRRSQNPMVIKNGKTYIRFEGKLYRIKSQFHTHPSGSNYKPGRVGVSKADLRMFNRLGGNPMSILHKGNEWVISSGNQYQKYGYSYSLKNLGPW